MNCLHEVTKAHSDLCCAFLYIIAQNLWKIIIHATTVCPIQVTQRIGKGNVCLLWRAININDNNTKSVC